MVILVSSSNWFSPISKFAMSLKPDGELTIDSCFPPPENIGHYHMLGHDKDSPSKQR